MSQTCGAAGWPVQNAGVPEPTEDGQREREREKEEWWGGTPVNRYKISSAIFPGKFSAAIVKRRPPPPRVFIAKSICETRVRGQECCWSRVPGSLYPWNARSAHSGHRRRLLRGGPVVGEGELWWGGETILRLCPRTIACSSGWFVTQRPGPRQHGGPGSKPVSRNGRRRARREGGREGRGEGNGELSFRNLA